MGRNAKLKFMRKETRKVIREHVAEQRAEAAAAINVAMRDTIERTRNVLRPRPWWLPRPIWWALKRIVLRFPLRDGQ